MNKRPSPQSLSNFADIASIQQKQETLRQGMALIGKTMDAIDEGLKKGKGKTISETRRHLQQRIDQNEQILREIEELLVEIDPWHQKGTFFPK